MNKWFPTGGPRELKKAPPIIFILFSRILIGSIQDRDGV